MVHVHRGRRQSFGEPSPVGGIEGVAAELVEPHRSEHRSDTALDLALVLVEGARPLADLRRLEPLVEELADRGRGSVERVRLDLGDELRERLAGLLLGAVERPGRLARLSGQRITTGERTQLPMTGAPFPHRPGSPVS